MLQNNLFTLMKNFEVIQKKFCSFLIIFCLIVNCFLPKIIFEQVNVCNILSQVITNQTKVLQIASFNSLAIKIMNCLVKWNSHSLTAKKSFENRAKKSKKEKNTCPNDTIINFDKRISKYDFYNIIKINENIFSNYILVNIDQKYTRPIVLYLILLLLLFVLPRSSINSEAEIGVLLIKTIPNLFYRLGFFILYEYKKTKFIGGSYEPS